MTNDVWSERGALIAFCTSTSVRVFTDDVASSRISTYGRAQNFRAMASNCFSSAETLPPSSSSTVS